MLDSINVLCYNNLWFPTFRFQSLLYYFASFHNYFYYFVNEVYNINSSNIAVQYFNSLQTVGYLNDTS